MEKNLSKTVKWIYLMINNELAQYLTGFHNHYDIYYFVYEPITQLIQLTEIRDRFSGCHFFTNGCHRRNLMFIRLPITLRSVLVKGGGVVGNVEGELFSFDMLIEEIHHFTPGIKLYEIEHAN